MAVTIDNLLYGATLKFGTTDGITVGKVIDASGSFATRNAPEYNICEDAANSILPGLYAYGALTVRCACYTTASAINQVLRGAKISVNSSVIGHLTSIGGNLMTRNTPEVMDCDSWARTLLLGTFRYGALNVGGIYDFDDDGDYDDLIALITSATPEVAVSLTLGDGMAIATTSAILTELALPGASGPEGRLDFNYTLQPTSDGVWEVTGVSAYKSLLDKAVVAHDPPTTTPIADVEFAFDNGATLTADAAVITSLEAPSSGGCDDQVTYAVTLQPINGKGWEHAGVEA
ncbi:MAG: hypothetical protein WCR65_03810 [Parcubacteria group bacterium]|jgi:hypothetical protein|nr:hypothetical protein [Planctomycetota bacterium]